MKATSCAPVLLAMVLVAGAAGLAPAVASADRSSAAAEQRSSFGERLAEAALAQTWVPVLYDPSYRQIPYPMGDVPWYIGVCTDVVIRAYRALGIDLQEKVHKARVGSGDRNIDHRRVTVLRRFFRKFGQNLGKSQNPDAYKPGDIVTYHLPNGQLSKTHIAIVSTRKSADGVPLIIHNRGWGVHEEDRLFAEPITGHFRYPR